MERYRWCARSSVPSRGVMVATIAEGEDLRAAAITRPILVFTPLLVEDFVAARRANLTPTLGDPRAIAAWIETAVGAPWHLAIDTGMNRAGVPDEKSAQWLNLHDARHPKAHSRTSIPPTPTAGVTEEQLDRFSGGDRCASRASALPPR